MSCWWWTPKKAILNKPIWKTAKQKTFPVTSSKISALVTESQKELNWTRRRRDTAATLSASHAPPAPLHTSLITLWGFRGSEPKKSSPFQIPKSLSRLLNGKDWSLSRQLGVGCGSGRWDRETSVGSHWLITWEPEANWTKTQFPAYLWKPHQTHSLPETAQIICRVPLERLFTPVD